MSIFAVLGDPISHSKSPWVHRRFGELTGIRLEYDAVHVPNLHAKSFYWTLQTMMRIPDLRGVNVTSPYKFAAVENAAVCSGEALLTSTANVITFMGSRCHVDNTDGVGLVRDIQSNHLFDLKGRSVLMIGAGGAAFGVVPALVRAEVGSITVLNRTPRKAENLRVHFGEYARRRGTKLQVATDLNGLGSFDLVLNASADVAPGLLTSDVFKPTGMAYDMRYAANAKGFLGAAAGNGCRTADGAGMLVEQAAEAFHKWHGVFPPTKQVITELRALLASEAA